MRGLLQSSSQVLNIFQDSRSGTPFAFFSLMVNFAKDKASLMNKDKTNPQLKLLLSLNNF